MLASIAIKFSNDQFAPTKLSGTQHSNYAVNVASFTVSGTKKRRYDLHVDDVQGA